jgi:serine/threonine protein kinase
MLINPSLDTESDIIWRCDHCEDLLNVQPGFTEDCGIWKCANCGYENRIDASEVYDSEDELRVELENPYRGLSDAEVLELSLYEEVKSLGHRDNVSLVREIETGNLYVRKILEAYDRSIYDYLKDHPVDHMPAIKGLYEGTNALIVIEEYISGRTLEDILDTGKILDETQTIHIMIELCRILERLHSLEKPIVHRDVKPSNVIISPEGEVWLLDMNVAKWHDPDEKDDTRHMGTWLYAAPEQVGYGMKASSPKTDIYAVGMLMNVMLTGAFPKEKTASGELGTIIEKCIRLNAEERYSAAELREALTNLQPE